MDLPLLPPVKPMLAKAVTKVPTAEGMFYEPKWDGFRCIVFRDGDEVELGSRNERPLTRYFPEVVEAVKAALPERCVVDGEIVVPNGDRLHFEALLQRIHPAESRIRLLAEQTPASFVAFDLLAIGDESLMETPFAQRRARLQEVVTGTDSVHVTAITQDPDTAQRWFQEFEGAGLDGVVAKPADLPYGPDQRLMTKVKHVRTADCVVAGFRWHKSGPIVGSLLLGLYDDSGDLQHIGVAASFPMARRAELVEELAPYRAEALDGHPWQDWANAQVVNGSNGDEHRMPGAQSRWNAGKDLSWVPMRPELVVEVKYDQLEGRRLRHTGQFLRWRPDREARSCTYDQLEVPVRYDLAEVFDG
ncbi:ATP-dependent DNA ligase [Geodermatophilus obscurus]|uniref:DNA ligase (ATP) n=1 Tax=Geodermatophilus obscurus (strain ATCC 25078 / DSM 43160 / JCM 3152 / CCUG 61914 / KCC A-0152 / KCTC 9177 / NBRC 13315 / NRRL B-3577 / G-20) TaxID=526225 RepID=D2SEV3_GEOOG|nr:ATP-dependent DNA ligase [Geodermatophilus obscurus]ADB74643.1 ATP dependent DNA ligase [Geodermatophilus obscurus DSM 43160]